MTNNLYCIDKAENHMGRCLVLKAPWSDDLIEIIRRESISVLRLTEGWEENEISFLKTLKDIGLRGVEIDARDVKHITPLQSITGLEYLRLQCKFVKAPDFSTFNKLKICKLVWQPEARTVLNCPALKFLNVVNYPFDHLQDLGNITKLERLQLTSKKLTSLSGIEELQSLKILELAECPKLVSLSGIEKCQQLHTIELKGCKKVNDVSGLGKLGNLRDVVLADCGKVKSLRPLANCRLLENLTFVGNTTVEDGKLTPLLKIPKLQTMWFVDKRHYSHERDQVTEMLEGEDGF